jgi:hypothetical protein
MRRTFFKFFVLPGLLLAISLAGFRQTAAQSGAHVWLSPPQVEKYPEITAFLDVHDAAGNFVHGLNASDLNILETTRKSSHQVSESI